MVSVYLFWKEKLQFAFLISYPFAQSTPIEFQARFLDN